MAVINVNGVTKIYKQQQKKSGFLSSFKSLFESDLHYKTAVDQISFQINQGEIIGLLGPNGAGKTTVLKLLSGILYPTKGELEVAGYVPYLRDNNYKKQIALIVGQKNQLNWDLPAIDTMLWLKEIYELNKKTFDHNLKQLTDIFQARDLLSIQVRRMSLGQRMKMELIASMIHNPKVVFLDEPTIGLDLVSQHNFHEFIREYNKRTNATIVLTSHNLLDIETLCDKVILINNGKIMHNDTTKALINRYCDYKLITLIRVNETFNSAPLMNGLDILEKTDEKIVLKARRDICQEAIKSLWSNYTFSDFKVEDVGIDMIIEKAYSQTS